MNTVTPMPKKKKFVWTGTIRDLIGDNFKHNKTAFIGTCGCEEENLFLVTYEDISLAKDPKSTWSSAGCNVEVIRFVDVNITVIGESKNE